MTALLGKRNFLIWIEWKILTWKVRFRDWIQHRRKLQILDWNYTDESKTGYNLPRWFYEIIDTNIKLLSLNPSEVEVNVTVDKIRTRTNLTLNNFKKFTEKSVFTPYVLAHNSQNIDQEHKNSGKTLLEYMKFIWKVIALIELPQKGLDKNLYFLVLHQLSPYKK